MHPLSLASRPGSGAKALRRVLRVQLTKGEEAQTRQPDARFGAKEGSGNGIRSQTLHDEDSLERYELSAGVIPTRIAMNFAVHSQHAIQVFLPPFNKPDEAHRSLSTRELRLSGTLYETAAGRAADGYKVCVSIGRRPSRISNSPSSTTTPIPANGSGPTRSTKLISH